MTSSADLAVVLRMVDELSAPMQKAANSVGTLQKQAEKTHGVLGKLGSALGDVGKIAAGVAIGQIAVQAAQAFTGALPAVTEFGAQVRTLARESGASAEQASGLLAAMDRFGVSGEQASVSLGIFSKKIEGLTDASEKQLETGKGFIGVMEDLGISTTDASGKFRPMYDVLLDTADAFHKMPDGVEKTGDAMNLFGRSGRDMILFLNQGREGLQEAMDAAKKYGLVLTGDNLEAVRKFGLAHKDLDEAMQGLAVQAGLVLLPILTKLAEAGAGLAQAFATTVEPALQSLADLAGVVASVIGDTLGHAFTAAQGLIAAFTVDAGGMGIVLEEIRKIFGDTVADAIEPFVQAFMAAIPSIQAFAGKVMTLVQGVGNVVSDVLSGDVGLAFDDFRKGVALTGADLVTQLKAWAQAFTGWIGPMLPQLVSALSNIVDAVFGWIVSAIPLIARQLNQWGTAFLEWIIPLIPQLVRQLEDIANSVIDWIGTAVPELLGALADWAAAFLEWVAPLIPPLLGELAQISGEIIRWAIEEALPRIASTILTWGEAFIGWVAPRIGPMLAELGSLLEQLGGWLLNTALPNIAEHLVKWGQTFIDWVGPQIPPLLAELGNLLSALGTWITGDAVKGLTFNLVRWGKAFVEWVADVVPQIPSALKQIIDSIVAWVTGEGGTQLRSQGTALGSAMVQGMIAGIGNLAGSLRDAAGRMALNALSGAQQALDAHSPSRKFYVLGQNVIEGLDLGILQNIPKLAASGALMGVALVTSANTAMASADSDLTAYIKQSATKHGIDYQTALRVAMSEGGTHPGAVGDNGSSFGPFQLHVGGVAGGGNSVGGLGDSFRALTGLDPRDITSTWQQIDFAMAYAAQHGWSAWHGAAAVGISDWQGIGAATRSANAELDVADTTTTRLSGSASSAGSAVLTAMEGFASSVDQIARNYADGLVSIQDKTSTALETNGQKYIDKYEDIVARAQDELNRLGGSLAEPESYDVQLSALQKSLDDKKALQQAYWSDQQTQKRLQRDLDKADADYRKALTSENHNYERDLEHAKTAAQKASIEERHADRLADLTRGLAEQKDNIDQQFKQATQDTAQQRVDQQTQRQWIEDNIEKPLTEFKQTELVRRRDADIAAAKEAADKNFITISTAADNERAKLLETARGKLADVKQEFLDKLPGITEEQQGVIDGFLSNVEATISDTLGTIPDALNKALSDSVVEVSGYVSDINDEIDKIDTNVVIDINTQYSSGGQVAAGYGSGGGGSSDVPSGTRIGDTPSTYDERQAARDAGFYVDSTGVYKMASGGIVTRPTYALIGESGPEAVVPLSRMGGGTTINLTVNGTVVTPDDLVNSIHAGLLRKQRRNGSLGLA